LNQIQDSQIALLLVHGKDEIKRGVVPIDKLDTLPPFRDAPIEVIAKGIGSLCHLLEDLADDALLGFFADLLRGEGGREGGREEERKKGGLRGRRRGLPKQRNLRNARRIKVVWKAKCAGGI
jgi:hypothetical protein